MPSCSQPETHKVVPLTTVNPKVNLIFCFLIAAIITTIHVFFFKKKSSLAHLITSQFFHILDAYHFIHIYSFFPLAYFLSQSLRGEQENALKRTQGTEMSQRKRRYNMFHTAVDILDINRDTYWRQGEKYIIVILTFCSQLLVLRVRANLKILWMVSQDDIQYIEFSWIR